MEFVDTLRIDGRLCKKLNSQTAGLKYNMYVPQWPITSYSASNEYITSEENGIVYLYNGSEFDTIINFNAVPGDKWQRIGGCSERQIVEVIDTGHVYINGFRLKAVSIKDQHYIIKCLERIGFVNEYLYLREHPCVTDGDQGGFFNCYSDNGFGSYMSPLVRTCINTVSISEIVAEISQIMPNPNHGFFRFYLPRAATISVLGLSGQILFQQRITDAGISEIDITSNPPGVYIFEIEIDGTKSRRKFILTN